MIRYFIYERGKDEHYTVDAEKFVVESSLVLFYLEGRIIALFNVDALCGVTEETAKDRECRMKWEGVPIK